MARRCARPRGTGNGARAVRTGPGNGARNGRVMFCECGEKKKTPSGKPERRFCEGLSDLIGDWTFFPGYSASDCR